MEGTISSNFVPVCVIPKVDSPIVEEKNVRFFPQPSDLTLDCGTTSIVRPVTLPDSDGACAEQSLDVLCAAIAVSPPPNMRCFDLIDDGSRTPKESIFDPFAPVDDKFMLAPRRRKSAEESRNSSVRQLNFSSTTNLVSGDQEAHYDTISEEEQMFDIVYRDLLDVITLERIKEFASESLSQVSDSDGFCTPKFTARLAGITETCPGAPMKSIRKYRNIEKTLCRKLEY